MLARPDMPPFARRRRVGPVLACALLCAPALAVAQQFDPVDAADGIPAWEWPGSVEAPLRTFFEREDVEAVLDGVDAPNVEPTPDVDQLASRLGPDVHDAFRFVQRRIRYDAYSGSLRGPSGTLRAGGGNALDQALLLRALLRAGGHQARLARGRLVWEDAVRLVGEARSDRPGRGDPWLRRVEAASDHWWVEVRQGRDWIAADPVFAGNAVGDQTGRRKRNVNAVPDALMATAQVELSVLGRRLAGLRLPLAELFGRTVQVSLAAHDAGDVGEIGDDPTGVAGPEVEQPGAVEPEETDTASLEVRVQDPLDRAPVEAALPMLPPGPIGLEVRAGGHAVRALPVSREQLSSVRLEIDIQVPPGRHIRSVLPFGSDPWGRISVLIAGGTVRPGALAGELAALHSMLLELNAAEIDALQAWRSRPPDEAGDPDADAPVTEEGAMARPLPAPPLPPPPGEAPAEPLIHPAIALHVAALHAWTVFTDRGLDAIALALLAAADQLQPRVPVAPADVRLVGLQYAPASPSSEGRLTVWISDPGRVSGAVRQRPAVQEALGILQSAVAGQVLNRFADRSPTTAYDLTLRAVGSGSRLAWFRAGDELALWPEEARRAAGNDLAVGLTVVGPTQPLERNGTQLLAWWSLAPGSGLTAGRVEQPLGVAQAAVAFGPAVERRSLDSILASLHDLHVATRWLLSLGNPDAGPRHQFAPGACAATPLVAELLRAGAPADFVAPAFAAFCQRPAS